MSWMVSILKTWMHILFGLGVFITLSCIGFVIYQKILDRMDRRDLFLDRLDRFSK